MPSGNAAVTPRAQVPLAALGTLGVGGPARWYARAGSPAEVAAADAWARARGVALFVLGGGSNLVIADAGLDALVVHMAIAGVDVAPAGEGVRARAGAGEPWDAFVAGTVARGLHGLECLSGIPGLVGGTPIQNVGAYGQEVADTIETVTVYDRTSGTVTTLGGGECGFAYRTSRFKREDADRFVVCDVTFRLHEGAPAAPRYPDVVAYLEQAGAAAPSAVQVREAVLAIRRRKAMVLDPDDPDTRSVGSFFMNPVVAEARREQLASAAGVAPPAFAAGAGQVKIPAAWLIERAGFERGHRDGRVGISSKHTLALVNRGGATAREVIRLAARIKRTVGERFDVWLRPEPVFAGFEGDPDVEFLRAVR